MDFLYQYMYIHVSELFHCILLFAFFCQSKYKEKNTGTRLSTVQLIMINIKMLYIMENIKLKNLRHSFLSVHMFTYRYTCIKHTDANYVLQHTKYCETK